MTEDRSHPARWMIYGAFSFATMGAMTHALGSRCDWLLIALVRIGFTFVSTVLLARLSGARLVVWRPATLWVRSFAGSLSLVCTFYALTRMPIAEVLTLTNTYPLWIVLFSWWEMRRPPSRGDLFGVACAICGVYLVQQPRFDRNNFALLVALSSSVWTAVAMMGLHRLREIDPKAVVVHFSGVASVFTATWLLARRGGRPAIVLDATTILLLLGVGLFGTIGQIFLTKAYAVGTPSKVAVVSLVQVVFALAYDIAIWGRKPTLLTLAGFVLVLMPTAWITIQRARRLEEITRPGAIPGLLEVERDSV